MTRIKGAHQNLPQAFSIELLKNNIDSCAPILKDLFNSCIKYGIFLDKLKLDDITPILKSVDYKSKRNYRPISILNSILDPRSQRAGSYKIGAVIVNV